MAKVYLHELDSVRTSEDEMKAGQWALYREIAVKGNVVVLTFNQLVDSPAFLCALDDEEYYESILSLMYNGRICVSSFRVGDEIMETPAHYLLSSLEKNVTPGELNLSVFVHSALPIKARPENKPVFVKLRDAVKYSDPQLLARYLEDETIPSENKRNATPEEKAFLDRYVRLIIAMSVTNEAHNDPLDQNQPRPIFTKLIRIVIDNLPNDSDNIIIGNYSSLDIKMSCNLLERILLSNPGQQDRSFWEEEIEKYYQKDKTNSKICSLAEAIVDLCYLYTCELSIKGLDTLPYQLDDSERLPIWNVDTSDGKNDSSCFSDVFLKELKNYVNSHTFLDVDNARQYKSIDRNELPDWILAARVVGRVENAENQGSVTTFLLLLVLSIFTIYFAITLHYSNDEMIQLLVIALLTIIIAKCYCNISIDIKDSAHSALVMAVRGVTVSLVVFIACIAFNYLVPFVGNVLADPKQLILFHFILCVIVITIHSIFKNITTWSSAVGRVSFRIIAASLCYVCLLYFMDSVGGTIQDSLVDVIKIPITAVGSFLVFALFNAIDFEDLFHIPDFDDCLLDLSTAFADWKDILKKGKEA